MELGSKFFPLIAFEAIIVLFISWVLPIMHNCGLHARQRGGRETMIWDTDMRNRRMKIEDD